ncbi:MAG: hypothetical protein KGS72_08620, partial [Cyanobacteria bacterium REEB67]|nr:hypothetical protein [Cyanobacteria bacterium REEB67]
LTLEELLAEFQIFNSKCPDDGSWFEVLMEMLVAIKSLTCLKCGGCNFDHKYGERFGKCGDCNTIKWLTAEYKFFSKLRLPKAYLFMIYLKEKGYAFSANMFATLLKISVSTTWAIDRKIDLALYHKLESEVDFELVDSSACNDVYMRRSTCTPANTAAIEEQAAMEAMARDQVDAQAEQFKDDQNNSTSTTSKSDSEANQESTTEIYLEDHLNATLTHLQKKILAVLTNKPLQLETLVSTINEPISEILTALTMLELDGLISTLPGQNYAKVNQPKSPVSQGTSIGITERAKTFIADSINFIKQHFQGVSRKYVQLYLVDFWRTQEKQAGGKTISVFEACFDYKEISRAELKAFISPLQLKIFVPIASS